MNTLAGGYTHTNSKLATRNTRANADQPASQPFRLLLYPSLSLSLSFYQSVSKTFPQQRLGRLYLPSLVSAPNLMVLAAHQRLLRKCDVWSARICCHPFTSSTDGSASATAARASLCKWSPFHLSIELTYVYLAERERARVVRATLALARRGFNAIR